MGRGGEQSGDGAAPPRRWLALALALAAAQTALLVATALDKSNTADEATYIGRAAHQWNGDFTCTPALPQWGYGVALRIVDPTITDVPADPTTQTGMDRMMYARPLSELRRNLLAARAATMLVVVVAGLFLWAAARRFGPAAAAATHAMWCLSPLVLAHGSLAGLDGWVAAAMCVVLWAGFRFVERPTLLRAAVAGGAVGLAACAKATALPVIPVLVAVAVWAARRGDPGGAWARRALGRLGAGAAAFLGVVWALYGFRVAAIGGDGMCAKANPLWAGPSWPLPFPEWIEGLVVQLHHGYERGHLSYLAGDISTRGWWSFYLVSLALQTTLAAQAIALFRIVATAVHRPSRRELLFDAALLAYPLLLLVLMSAGRAQNGIKYLLPIYPFAMLCGGRAFVDVARLFGPGARRAVAAAALAVVLALGAASVLAVHPDHLMYFNAWAGGPDGGPRYLVHGSDWGQDVRRLGRWVRRRHLHDVYYLNYTGASAQWGVPVRPPPCSPAPGVYALHVAHLYRPQPQWVGCWDWLTVEPPDERIGHSIYIYQVDEARIERLRDERGRVEPFVRTGPH